jgi:hypothetical protein
MTVIIKKIITHVVCFEPSNIIDFLIIWIMIPTFIIGISFLYAYANLHLFYPTQQPTDVSNSIFSESRARKIIDNLTKNIGPREIGMRQNEDARVFIRAQILDILKNINVRK